MLSGKGSHVCSLILQHSLVSELFSVATHRISKDVRKLSLDGALKAGQSKYTVTYSFSTIHLFTYCITNSFLYLLTGSHIHSLINSFIFLPKKILEDSYVQTTIKKLNK